ncbi:MAG: prenyltransferase/squalene oxidase repeat-containing protein [Verrucomicrobiales bacterium]
MNPEQPPHDPNNPQGQYPEPQPYQEQGYVDPNMVGYPGTETSPIAYPTQPLDAVSQAQLHAAETRSKFAALAMALLVHGLIIALLAWIVLDVMNDEAPEIIVETAQGESDIPIVKKEFMQNMQQKPSAAASQASTVISAAVLSPVALPTIEDTFEDAQFGMSIGDGDFGAGGLGLGTGGGGMGIPGSMKGRCNQADRAKRLRENGGKPGYDKKVVKALDWLKGKQNQDGSWGSSYPVSMTAFAILAYSGHCETVDSPKYGETIIKAIDYLIEFGRKNNGAMGKPGNHLSYEHGIATYALSEAYSLNKNSKAKTKYPISSALRNAVPVIIEGQTKGGGWLYAYGQKGVGDLSVAGWNIQALKAAKLTGRPFKGLDKAMKSAREYISAASAPNGLYRYRITDKHPGRLSLTGVGVLCARMLGKPQANEDKSFKAILDAKPKNFRGADLYALYYHSQACFQKGGKEWKSYNLNFQELIADSQEADGSWPIAAGHMGSIAGDAKIYHTCLSTLMLEVYYRYLPATDKA